MKDSKINPYMPLLKGTSQYEVDFVIPRIGADLPLGIDPFLLFKSREPFLNHIHESILKMFNYGINLISQNKVNDARYIFKFPEVAEIGLGYTRGGKRGSGVGDYLSELIINTLLDSPDLCSRGVKHIEEMQLVSVNIGPDRISDIAANIFKRQLIDYTQKQCEIWRIPLISKVPIGHIFNTDDFAWYDGYYDLPISPLDKAPILFVPRRIVRTLPWINYDDYFRLEFSMYLRAKKIRGRLIKKDKVEVNKEEIANISRREVDRIDKYISKKEATSSEAQPSLNYFDLEDVRNTSNSLREKLLKLEPGKDDASDYHLLILEILNYLFNPELIDGDMEVKTIDGTERRDIIFTNDSDQTFWTYLRSEHSGIFLMFEVKNTKKIEIEHLNQTATYLGDRLGRIGFIVTRNPIESAQNKKVFSIYNDSHPRKIILIISDSDLMSMMDIRSKGENPMRYIQNLYRNFRMKVQ